MSQSRNWVIGGLLLVVPLIFLQANLKSRERLNAFDRLLVGITAPLQAALVWSVEGVGGLWQRYVGLVDIREERDRLRAERDALLRQVTGIEEELQEKGRLERLLGFIEQRSSHHVGARVVAVGADPLLRTVRVDRGRTDGLRPYQPVVAAQGVVGRVLDAAEEYADILLLTDRGCGVAVLVGDVRARGTLVGAGADDEPCRVEYLRRPAEVQVGDRVVTSGLDGVFPKGLPLGRVIGVRQPTHGLFQEAQVSAEVDFGTLEEVLVLVGEEVGQ